MLFTLELYASQLEDQAVPFPEQVDRLRRDWLERDTPRTEQALRVLEALTGFAPGKEDVPEPDHFSWHEQGSS
jgi:hypothetical protein